MSDWPDIRLKAFNTDPDSDNKIHSDEEAAKYGFKGGLVTGVSMYAYMTQAIVAQHGRDWLDNFSKVSTKLIHPVYDGDAVTVTSSPQDDGMHIELHDSEGTLCGIADIAPGGGIYASRDEPLNKPLPAPQDRYAPTIESFPDSTQLGSFPFAFERESHEQFCEAMLDASEIYKGDSPVWHPAWVVANANWMLMANVALGPWIHTGSSIFYMKSPRLGAQLLMEGCVVSAYERRGNDMVNLFLTVYEEENIVAQLKHTAIIRLAQDKD